VLAPSKEERVLAGIAHLALYGGFWLIAPIGLYFYKKKDSPFVAFHAVQACLLQVAAVPLGIAGLVLGLAGAAVLGGVGVSNRSEILAGIAPLSVIGGATLPGLLILFVSTVAGVRALRGREWMIPGIGRLAKSLIE
jgi:uncharacterized Tic20 family protein